MQPLTRTSSIVIFLILLLSSAQLAAALPIVHHQIDAVITPDTGEISVNDTMTLPQDDKAVRFHLHPGLEITGIEGGQLTTTVKGTHTVQFSGPKRELTLHYSGKIRDALVDVSDSAGKTQHTTHGWIGPEGVFLSGSAPWYPLLDNTRVEFDLTVTLPNGWSAISQGIQQPDASNHWRETNPQDDIYLIAGKYRRYESTRDKISAQVYLHQPDSQLAQRYLQATHRYLQLYNTLIGRYPYRKFALVENFWNTGYGMPSFTLLGPAVIRLPFIIHTSYPHEILHNWFGNGVFVDYSEGNWSEGLTTYLADHLLREKRGKAADYRRSTLQNFANHAVPENDFPLSQFTARHGDSSQAIGYGKSMMFFHMLRIRLGDKAFFQGLQDFFSRHLFQQASYDDLRTAWEKSSGKTLKPFFNQWLNRTGAPRLSVENATLSRQGNHTIFSATLLQSQHAAPFPLTVPVTATFADGQQSVTKNIEMNSRKKSFTLELQSQPKRVAIDLNFDVFRQLYPEESPATLSALFGSRHVTIVLPSNAPTPLLKNYQSLARQWQAKRQNDWKIITDKALDTLPKGQDIILLGWENRLVDEFVGKHPDRLENKAGKFQVQDHTLNVEKDSLALALKNSGSTTLLVATSNPKAIPGLARKLPHYGKYGLLVFSGDQPEIREKMQWEILRSPLTFSFGD
ncbi:MAG TPA: M1 family peptidase [Gammaproteobacteria bacterium]|nr:M1 family peptidase [Gammaproteobacteria bacterium]